MIFVGIIILIVSLFLYISPIEFKPTEDFTIPAKQGISRDQHYERGERIEGYFTVRSGNEQVEFSIKDPYGTAVYDPGTVTSRHDFGITTEHSGLYSLFWGNTDDYGKIVYLTAINRILSRSLIIGLAILGICVLFLGLAHRMRLPESEQEL